MGLAVYNAINLKVYFLFSSFAYSQLVFVLRQRIPFASKLINPTPMSLLKPDPIRHTGLTFYECFHFGQDSKILSPYIDSYVSLRSAITWHRALSTPIRLSQSSVPMNYVPLTVHEQWLNNDMCLNGIVLCLAATYSFLCVAMNSLSRNLNIYHGQYVY